MLGHDHARLFISWWVGGQHYGICCKSADGLDPEHTRSAPVINGGLIMGPLSSFCARSALRSTPRRRYRPHLEGLEERTLLNNRFVVPAGLADNQSTFATLEAALTTPGLNAHDVIQIEAGSAPGTIKNADLPQLANLTIQGDPAAGLAGTPSFNVIDAITIGASQAGFTLQGVNVDLVDTGSLTFNANASILGSTIVDSASTALNAVTLSGLADVISGSTLVNNASLPLGSSLVLVTPGAAGSNNLITGSTFVGNAQSDALLIYQAATAATVTDHVANNTFMGNPGSNIAELLLIGEPTGTMTNSGQIAGLTIQNNSFADADTDVTAIELHVTGTGTTIAGNTINLTAQSGLSRGIVVVAGPGGTTTTATIAGNQINTNGFGTGLEADLGPATTSILNLKVQGNDFHDNAIGILIQPPSGGTSTAPVSGIDLGGGSQGSLGGNNFASFSSAASTIGTSGAIVLSGVAASQGTLKAQQNIFAAGLTPGTAIFDPNNNVDLSNPLTASAAFVETLYVDLLRRAGNTTSSSDAGFWVSQLAGGMMTPSGVAADIIRSPEAVGLLVDGLYLNLLGRASDAGGRAFFASMLQGGAPLEQVIAIMVGSPEFATLTGSGAAFVQSLYSKLLGRTAGSSEIAFWMSALPSMGRTGVASGFTTSPEFRSDIVQQLYAFTSAPAASVVSLSPGLLHRTSAPTAAEVSFWVSSGGDALTTAVGVAASAEFLGGGAAGRPPEPAPLQPLHRHASIVANLGGEGFSTIPPTGPAELNPYGVAFTPANFPTTGTLQPGDLLVANFNDPANIQGNGTTIVRITPGGQRSTFFTSTQMGLDAGLAVVQAGFVIVANLPNVAGNPGQGSLQVLDSNGVLVKTITDANLLNGPWDLTVNDQGSTVQVFVSNVSKNVSATAAPNGTVTRIDLHISGSTVTVQDMVQIASGYATRTDAAAFVVGPSGLAFDSHTGTLYVASEAEKVNGTEAGTIFAVAKAGTTTTDGGKGTVVFADANHLRGPLGLVLLPNGDLMAANNDSVNANPAQPSEMIQFTKAGRFVSQFSLDPSIDGPFSMTLTTNAGQVRFAALNDNQNTVTIWSFVPEFGNPYTLSTIPPTGPAELNPYGVAFAPPNFPGTGTATTNTVQPGDMLVSNFNDPANVQGTGTTIVRITPTGQRFLFFTSPQQGLDAGLAVLQAGFVLVANVPNVAGNPGQGSLQILDASGTVVKTLTDASLLNGPWDLTVNDQGSLVQVFVSTVSKNVSATAAPNGTVTRIDLQISGGTVTVQDMVQIASGYATRTDAAAFVLGPAGLAYDPRTDTLYVASEAEKVGGVETGTIFAIPNAGKTTADHGKGTVVFADPAHLHAPLGLLLAPNGHLILANNDGVNIDTTQPSELVEITPRGRFVSQFSLDPSIDGPFGIALSSVHGRLGFAALNDNQNTVELWTFQTGVSFRDA
jgi:hypothetical protein